MRQIKFRGKSLVTGKYLFGAYFLGLNDWHYIRHTVVEGDRRTAVVDAVDSETIGQFTGLQDKNGKDIYEGDIISHDNGITKQFTNVEVKFWEGSFIAGIAISRYSLINYNVPNYIEVTGNIHE